MAPNPGSVYLKGGEKMVRMEAVENWELFERVREVGLKLAAAAGGAQIVVKGTR